MKKLMRLNTPFNLSVLLLFLLVSSSTVSAQLRWKNVKHACLSPGNGEVTANLDGIPWGQSWEDTCGNKIKGQRPPNLNKYGATGLPYRCEKDRAVGATGIWGKWRVANDSRCPSALQWKDWKKAGCFGPNKQVYSARLMGSKNWEAECAASNTAGVAGKENWGTPDRCAKDAFKTGIWGEWYREEACSIPLKWENFVDNGCVKDMEKEDANSGAVSSQGMRSYSSVLWNAGGDWVQACKFAPAKVLRSSGAQIADFEHPTACVLADADRAISYVVGAVIGAATSLITSPASPKVAASAGAITGVAGTAASEAILAGINTNLNVWGIFWVEDASCGIVKPHPPLDNSGFVRLASGQIVATTTAVAEPSFASRSLTSDTVCPDTVVDMRGTGRTIDCLCTVAQTGKGTVWGTGPYTDDSKICRAAVHAGVISSTGGHIEIQAVKVQPSYQGSSRNGIQTTKYGPWKGSIIVRRPR